MVLLLAAVLFLNYVDRGVLPTVAAFVQRDLELSDSQLGVLFSAFFWTYATIQIPVGWLAERYGAARVLAWGLALWALATMLVGLASSYLLLLVLRLLLGLGESVGFPCTSKILAQTVPSRSLGEANGIVAFAYLLGPAVGIFAGGELLARYGWRTTFVVFGALSLLWLWPWSKLKIERYVVAATPPAVDVASTWSILKQRALWGTGLGHFAANYTFYFMLSWLPVYLVRERGFSTLEMARLASSAYLLNAVFALVGGWITDRYIARGGSTTFIYKLMLGGAQLGAMVCMVCMAVGPRPVALACIFAYQILCGLGSPGVFAAAQIIAGPAAAGRWVGIQNTIGNLAGILAPALTGLLIDATGHFTLAFVAAAAVGVLGICGWVLLVSRVEELNS